MKKNRVAFVLARKNSKRIPKKNHLTIKGKDIISYPIDAMINSKKFDKVVVATDDEELIKKVKYLYCEKGIQTHYLPFIDDDYPLYKTLVDIKMVYIGVKEIFVSYATSAMLTTKIIDNAIDKIKEDTKTVLGICRYEHPIERALHKTEKGLDMQKMNYEFIRTQKLKPKYYDCGMFYLMNTKMFLDDSRILTSTKANERIEGLELSPAECQDLDEPYQIDLLKMKMSIR